MAISRCNKCGTISEHERELIETRQACGQCGTPTLVYDTVFFVKKLSDMYFAQRKELNAIRPSETTSSQVESKKVFETFDIHNSDYLSSQVQHKPIVEWFKSKNIIATANFDAVDTTGFFDEAAIAIGTDYDLLGEVCERIRYAQQKEYSSNLVYLDKKSKEDAKSLEAFIQQLYKHSLIARCISNKKEKNIRIVLQNAPSVRRFFAGDWLEWYAPVSYTHLDVYKRQALVRCSSRVKSANNAVTTAETAPAPCSARPMIMPSIFIAKAATMLPTAKIASPK